MEEHFRKLVRLQTAVGEAQREPRNSYAHVIVVPRLLQQLKQAVEEAREAGITEDDIDDLVAELEVTTERRPIELENFWDPRRMSKGWRERRVR